MCRLTKMKHLFFCLELAHDLFIGVFDEHVLKIGDLGRKFAIVIDWTYDLYSFTAASEKVHLSKSWSCMHKTGPLFTRDALFHQDAKCFFLRVLQKIGKRRNVALALQGCSFKGSNELVVL